MARYRVAFTTTATAAGTPLVDVEAVASDRPRIREIGFFLNAATASNIGIGRSGNTPVPGAGTGTLGQAEEPGDPVATGKVWTAWATTAPTIPSAFMMKLALPATIGAGFVLTFPYGDGLIVNATNSLVLWNYGGGACSVLNGYIAWDE